MRTKPFAALLLLLVGCGPTLIGNPPDCEDDGKVEAVLSSVTLAQDCPDPRVVADFAQGICAAESGCDSLCRQTSMQLSFDSTRASIASIKIVSVRVLEIDSRQELDKLTPREPTQWQVDKYVTWNERVPAQSSVKASYKLSAPRYDSFATDANRFAFPQKFLVEVVVDIDGDLRTLSIEAQREPEVVT